jgi:cobalt-zinc-cadmium efflux system membrane fusion protein
VSRFRSLLAAVAAIASLISCGPDSESAREERAIKDATPQRVRPDGSIQLTDHDRTALDLIVSPAVEGDLPESTLRFGRVLSRPGDEAQVVSPVTGRISQSAVVQLGASVRAGTMLLEIVPILDTPDRISIGTQTAEREGQIEAAERELAQAEADATRARALSPQVVSAAKLQEAETAVARARARLEGLRNARTAATQAQTRPVSLTAPIAGVVSALNVQMGAVITKGDVLAQIVRDGPIWIVVSVPPDDLVGAQYEVATPSGPVAARLLVRGRVTERDGTRHDRVVVDATQSAVLRPGSTVPVQVARGIARGVVVPESALVPGVESDTVFVETSAGVFAARPVHVATRYGGKARLTSGLVAGERVVTQGAMALQGESVRAQLRPTG